MKIEDLTLIFTLIFLIFGEAYKGIYVKFFIPLFFFSTFCFAEQMSSNYVSIDRPGSISSVMDISSDNDGASVALIQSVCVISKSLDFSAQLAKVNRDGNVTETIDIKAERVIARAFTADDDAYLVAGVNVTGDKAMWLRKITAEGQTVWTRQYLVSEGNFKHWTLKLLPLMDSGIILYGLWLDKQQKKPYLFKLDRHGNMIWKHLFDEMGYVRSVAEDKTGDYLAAVLLFDEHDGSHAQYVYRYSCHGELISKTAVRASKFLISTIYALQNGMIALVGESKEFGRFESTLVVMNDKGVIQLDKRYAHPECPVLDSGEGSLLLRHDEETRTYTMLSSCAKQGVILRKLSEKGDVIHEDFQNFSFGDIKVWADKDAFYLGGRADRKRAYLLKVGHDFFQEKSSK